MRHLLGGWLAMCCSCELRERPLHEHDVVEVELGPAVDLGRLERLVRLHPDEAVQLVELLLELRLLAPHLTNNLNQTTQNLRSNA